MSEEQEPSGAWSDELDQVITRVRQDRATLGQALLAEQAASAQLRERLDHLTEERSQVNQQTARDAAKIERLTTAALEIEHHYEQALAERDLEIGELRARQDDVAEEWSSRYRRLAQGHQREVEAFSQELAAARGEIETLRIELSTERARSTTGLPVDETVTQADGAYIIEGDALAILIWPDLKMAESRSMLIDALDEYCEQTETQAEVLFQSELGLEDVTNDLRRARVRVPHDGIPLELVIRQLYDVHSVNRQTIVATNRSGFARSVNLVRFAAQMGLRTPPSRPALEATTMLDLLPVPEVVTVDRI